MYQPEGIPEDEQELLVIWKDYTNELIIRGAPEIIQSRIISGIQLSIQEIEED